MATRRNEQMAENEAKPERLKDIRAALLIGASPRASISLTRAAKGNALLEGRSYVIPDDIKAVAGDILRHRLILTFEAEARNLSTDEVVSLLLNTVSVP
jgi:MoxR-like ATPase